MQRCETKYFGSLEYDPTAVIEFPAGLPGFESERAFILIDRADLKPLVFVQSLSTPGLCFPTLPVRSVIPDYTLEVPDADLETLGLLSQPAIGSDVACLAVLNLREAGPVANLLAPLVIGLEHRRGIQTIVSEGDYSHEHPLNPVAPVEGGKPGTKGEVAAC